MDDSTKQNDVVELMRGSKNKVEFWDTLKGARDRRRELRASGYIVTLFRITATGLEFV